MLNLSGEERTFQSFASKYDTIILSTFLLSGTGSPSSSFCTLSVFKSAFSASSLASLPWKTVFSNQALLIIVIIIIDMELCVCIQTHPYFYFYLSIPVTTFSIRETLLLN